MREEGERERGGKENGEGRDDEGEGKTEGRRGGGESICVVIRLWVSNLAQKRQLTILASTYVAALECMSIQRLLVAVYCCL